MLIEVDVHLVGLPFANKGIRIAMAGAKQNKKAQKEKNRFFHRLNFGAKVGKSLELRVECSGFRVFVYFWRHKSAVMEQQKLQWFKTERREAGTFVFDPLRRKWVALTPEEEVRQKVLYLLVEHLHVPSGRIAVEYSVKVNGLDKRCDAVVFGSDAVPLMIVECKAQSVKLTAKTLDQAVRYYSALQPRFLLLYNGAECHCLKVESGVLQPMDHLPEYEEMDNR